MPVFVFKTEMLSSCFLIFLLSSSLAARAPTPAILKRKQAVTSNETHFLKIWD
jgi:hypothetical protein